MATFGRRLYQRREILIRVSGDFVTSLSSGSVLESGRHRTSFKRNPYQRPFPNANTLTVADRMQRHCQATPLTEVWRACSHLCIKRERAPTSNRQCLRSSLRALRFFFSAVVRNGNRHTAGSECPPQRSKASHKRIMPPPRVGDGQKLQSGLGSFAT